jgi:undecaprenyl-diphosphatase
MDQHRTERVTRLAESASLAGSAMVLIPAAMLAGVWIWRCAHRSGLAVLPPLALLDSEAIVQIANRIVDRARPLSGLAASTFGGSAWPSSNAASAMATAASVWVVTAALQRSMSIRRRVNGIAGFVAVLVALSPIVLGAHWTTDVLMGGVVGLTVVAVLTRPLLIGTMPMDDVSAIR